jgi:hypothetical protein
LAPAVSRPWLTPAVNPHSMIIAKAPIAVRRTMFNGILEIALCIAIQTPSCSIGSVCP